MRHLVFLFLNNIFAKSFSGISFNDKFVFGKHKTLTLNGVGFLKKYWFKIYAIALYLPKKNKNPEKIIKENNPMAIKLKIIYKVSLKQLKKGLKKGLKKNDIVFTKLQSEIEQFLSYFDKKPKKYDTATFFYMPEKGTFISTNGKLRGVIKGIEFKQLLFNIWLGKKPPSKQLKKHLLGKR